MDNAAILDRPEALTNLQAETAGSLEVVDGGDSVTAIIPSFGRPVMARRAIESALGQSYRRLDVILVIDGKDDRTRELAVALAPRYRSRASR